MSRICDKRLPTCADSWRVHCSCSSSVAGLSLKVGMASRASGGMSGWSAGRVRTAAMSSHKGSFCGRNPLSGPSNPLHAQSQRVGSKQSVFPDAWRIVILDWAVLQVSTHVCAATHMAVGRCMSNPSQHRLHAYHGMCQQMIQQSVMTTAVQVQYKCNRLAQIAQQCHEQET